MPFEDEQFEFRLMVEQPVKIVESLVDDVLANGAFVLKYHRAHVLIETERVDASAVQFSSGMLRRDEPDGQHWIEVVLDKRLKRLFQTAREPGNLGRIVVADAE